MLIRYPSTVSPGGGVQLNVGVSAVPDNVTLLTKGISPEPAKDSEVETLVGLVVALLNLIVQGLVRLAGLLFPVAVQEDAPA